MENNIDYAKINIVGQSIIFLLCQMEFTSEEVHELLKDLYAAHMKSAESMGYEDAIAQFYKLYPEGIENEFMDEF